MPDWFTEHAPKVIADRADWFTANSPRNEPKMSAATPGTALPEDQAIGESQQTRELMNAPLARPTGIDAIDSLTSPTSILGMAGPMAMRVAGKAAGAVGRIPMPSGATVLRGAKMVRHPIREAGKAVLDYAIDRMERPAVTPPAASVPAAAEAVAPKAAYLPNQALQSAKDAFAAIGEKPLKAEASNAMELIRRGKSPEEAISIVMRNRPAGAATVTEPAAKAAVPKLTAEEMRAGLDLIAKGKTPQQALDAVMAQRAFRQIPGVESNATVASRVAQRNATGRWP